LPTQLSPPGQTNSNALPVGYRLGEYEFEGVLGHGGFGITYVARDVRLGARVAIKEYFPQAYAGRDAAEQSIHPFTRTPNDAENYRWGLEAFLTEAQALARFKHTHIVRVLRFLEANGTAYLVMEYEEGASLLTSLRKHSGFLDESTLLGVFLPILTGLQAVHDAGLLHLDIKPDNIYLRRDGQPMLIDFGSARQVRGGDSAQKVALSRGYAAPEQYPGHGERGPWTDVYGVGAAIYRCITGKEPTDAMERMIGVAKIKHDPMVAATALERPQYSKHIRECVDAALQLDAGSRPSSARVLQNGLMGKGLKDADTRTFVPFGKGPGFIGVAGGPEQTRRRRRSRSTFEWLVATAVLITTAAVVIPKILMDTGRLTDTELLNLIDEYKTVAIEKSTEIRRYINEDILGMRHRPELPPPRPVFTRKREAAHAAPSVVAFNPQATVAYTLALPGNPGALAFAKAGSLLAVALDTGAVELWSTTTGERVRALAPPGAEPAVVAASADGRWLAWSGKDRSLWLWDAREDRAPLVLPGHIEAVSALAFSPDGHLLASAGRESSVILWEVESGKRHQDALPTRASIRALAFAPNGRVLAGADADGGLQYWGISVRDSTDGEALPVRKYGPAAEMSYLSVADNALTSVAFSPDGKWLAVGGDASFLKLLEVGVGRNDRTLTPAPDTVLSLAFTPDRKWLLVTGSDSAIRSWQLESTAAGKSLHGHNHDVYAVTVSSDGQLIASGGDDRTVRIWK